MSSISRRNFLSGSAALTAVTTDAVALTASSSGSGVLTGSNTSAPFSSMRDYLAALEANNLVVRFSGVDQDAFEATAIMYQLIDEFGKYNAPAVVFENLK
ncbi:MAG: twin-arginine translocation signal domain-containing protein, partial [Pseudomonadales bacterium]